MTGKVSSVFVWNAALNSSKKADAAETITGRAVRKDRPANLGLKPFRLSLR